MKPEKLFTIADIVAMGDGLTSRQVRYYRPLLLENGHAVEKNGKLSGIYESAVSFLEKEVKESDLKSGIGKRIRHINRHIDSLVDRLNEIDPGGKIITQEDIRGFAVFIPGSGWS